ncbi:MAG: membrane protein insertion efficiency factor YidD [Ignavibacterium sp.]|nr:membrane protein insertion efficiency factor YidD [Ignavibacterium sp.]
MLYSIRNSAVAILFFLFAVSLVAQTDWQRWDKVQPNYLKSFYPAERNFSYAKSDLPYLLSKTLINTYWIFISDLDGDNCPFHPSCSSFFLQSIEETNLIQGALMFFDRFTRDSNPVNREEHYPVYKNYRFYDPPKLYTLSKDKIHFIPPYTVVE